MQHGFGFVLHDTTHVPAITSMKMLRFDVFDRMTVSVTLRHAQRKFYRRFKATLRGRLIQPTDKDYDEARGVYNGMIHKKPRLIARCADVADVISLGELCQGKRAACCDSQRRTQRWRVGNLR